MNLENDEVKSGFKNKLDKLLDELNQNLPQIQFDESGLEKVNFDYLI